MNLKFFINQYLQDIAESVTGKNGTAKLKSLEKNPNVPNFNQFSILLALKLIKWIASKNKFKLFLLQVGCLSTIIDTMLWPYVVKYATAHLTIAISDKSNFFSQIESTTIIMMASLVLASTAQRLEINIRARYTDPQISSSIQDIVFSKILSHKMQFFQGKGVEDLVARVILFSNVVRDIFINVITIQVPDLASCIVLIISLGFINQNLFIISGIGFFVHLSIYLFTAKKASMAAMREGAQRTFLIAALGDCFANIEVIKSNGTEKSEREFITKFRSAMQKASRQSMIASEKPNIIAFFLDFLIFGLILYGFVFYLLLNNQISLPQVSYVLIGTMTLNKKLWHVSNYVSPLLTLIGYCTATAYALKLDPSKGDANFANEDAEIETRTLQDISKKPIISFENVSFSYKPGIITLNNISFNIPHGQRIAFVGKSGSGKTTTVRLLLKLIEPSSGSILIDGVNISSIKKEDCIKLISYMPQDSQLFSRSIFENITYGNQDQTLDDAIYAANISGAHSFIKNMEYGYESDIQNNGKYMSFGERQKILIARTILKDVKIIIMDEPTASIDHQSEMSAIKKIFSLFKDKTIIMITHNINNLSFFDKIAFFEDGSLEIYEDHKSVIEKISLDLEEDKNPNATQIQANNSTIIT